jgi:hypothetical protein
MGSGCIDPHFLDFGTSWRWAVSFTPNPLQPWGNSHQYPLDRRLGERQSRSGQLGEYSWTYQGLISDPLGVQPIASRYTGYATEAPQYNIILQLIIFV